MSIHDKNPRRAPDDRDVTPILIGRNDGGANVFRFDPKTREWRNIVNYWDHQRISERAKAVLDIACPRTDAFGTDWYRLTNEEWEAINGTE